MRTVRLNLRRAMGKVLTSRIFIIWLLIVVGISFLAATTGYRSLHTSPIDTSPLSKISFDEIYRFNVTGLELYAQSFNEYGDGIGGTYVYYNITAPSVYLSASGQKADSSLTIAHGYTGPSNETGILSFFVTGLTGHGSYAVNERVVNSADSYHLNYSVLFPVTFNPNNDTPGQVEITPVLSTAHPANYALHVLAFPSEQNGSSKLFYQRSNNLGTFFSSSNYFNYNQTVLIQDIQLDGTANYKTPINLTGVPYYYGIGIENASGTLVGTYFLSTEPTQEIKSDYLFGYVFGTTLPFVMIWCFVLIAILNSGRREGRSRWGNYALGRLEKLDTGNRSEFFISSLFLGVLTAIPIEVAILLVSAYESSIHYSTMPSIPDWGLYFSGFLLTILVTASFIAAMPKSRYFSLGSVHAIVGKRESSRRGRLISGIVAAVIYIYFFLNYIDFGFNFLASRIITFLNIINPFAYLFLLLQYVDSSAQFGTITTFSPGDYGITPLFLAILGALWLALFTALPYFVIRRSEQQDIIFPY